MADEILDALKPIAAILGPSAVKADYSDTQFYQNGAYRAGWKVTVNTTYRGAHLSFSNGATTLQKAAEMTLAELKTALEMA